MLADGVRHRRMMHSASTANAAPKTVVDWVSISLGQRGPACSLPFHSCSQPNQPPWGMSAQATLRLGARKGGLSDVASLKRELDSLRDYRDVLHDTMKGLVEASSGKLSADQQPSLASALAQVSAALQELAAEQRRAVKAAEQGGDIEDLAAQLEAARAEVAVQRDRAERAEQQSNEVASDADRVVRTQLVHAEQRRDEAELDAQQHRTARRAAERRATSLNAEALALDESLTSLAVRVEKRVADRDRAAAEARDTLAAAEAECGHLRDELAAAVAAAAAARAEASGDALARSRAASEALAERTAAEVAASEARAQAAQERRRAEQLSIERDRWKAEAKAAAAELAALQEQLRRVESKCAPPLLSTAPLAEAGPGKSRFAQYVEGLHDRSGHVTPQPTTDAIAGLPPSPRGRGQSTTDGATMGMAAAPATGLPLSALAGTAATAPAIAAGAAVPAMRPARERGGPLLRR